MHDKLNNLKKNQMYYAFHFNLSQIQGLLLILRSAKIQTYNNPCFLLNNQFK